MNKKQLFNISALVFLLTFIYLSLSSVEVFKTQFLDLVSYSSQYLISYDEQWHIDRYYSLKTGNFFGSFEDFGYVLNGYSLVYFYFFGYYIYPFFINTVDKVIPLVIGQTIAKLLIYFTFQFLIIKFSPYKKFSFISSIIFIFAISCNHLAFNFGFSLMRDTLIAGTLSYFLLITTLIYNKFDDEKGIYKNPPYLIFQYLFMGLIIVGITPRYTIFIFLTSIFLFTPYLNKYFKNYLKIFSYITMILLIFRFFGFSILGGSTGPATVAGGLLGPNPLTTFFGELTRMSELYISPLFTFFNFFFQLIMILLGSLILFRNKSRNTFEEIFLLSYFPSLFTIYIFPADVQGFRQTFPSALLLTWFFVFRFSSKYYHKLN